MSIAFRLLFLRKTAKTEKKIANEKSELEKKMCLHKSRLLPRTQNKAIILTWRQANNFLGCEPGAAGKWMIYG